MRTRQQQRIRKKRTTPNKLKITKKAPPRSRVKDKPFNAFVCIVCGKAFRTKNALTCHMLQHTEKRLTRTSALPKPKAETLDKRIPVVVLEKTLQCQVCGLITPNASLFKRHVSSHKQKLKKEDDDIVVLPLSDPLEITEEDVQSALKLQEDQEKAEDEVITLDSDGNEEEEESWLKIVSVRGSNPEGILKMQETENKEKKAKRTKVLPDRRRRNYKIACYYCKRLFRNADAFISHMRRIHKPIIMTS